MGAQARRGCAGAGAAVGTTRTRTPTARAPAAVRPSHRCAATTRRRCSWLSGDGVAAAPGLCGVRPSGQRLPVDGVCVEGVGRGAAAALLQRLGGSEPTGDQAEEEPRALRNYPNRFTCYTQGITAFLLFSID